MLIKLKLNRTPNSQRTERRPHALLALLDPVLEVLLGRVLQELGEVHDGEVRDEGQAGSRDGLLDEEPREDLRKVAKVIQLAQSVADFRCDKPLDGACHGEPACGTPVEEMHLGAEEWDEIGSGLGDDEMVDVE